MLDFWTLVGFGILLGSLLAIASLFLGVDADPKLDNLHDALPGYNCGVCGYVGCSGYAKSLAAGTVSLELCEPGGHAVKQKIAKILGVAPPAETEKYISCVFCNGGVRAIDAFAYSGMRSCRAAILVQGGYKKCRWGCLGFGDCVAVCPVQAITMSEQGLPVIDGDKCAHCSLCIKTCPRNILKRSPRREGKLVRCSNHDNGKAARSVCAAPCIGCGICVKHCLYQAVVLKDNLAVIDPAKCTNCGVCAEKCPTQAIK